MCMDPKLERVLVRRCLIPILTLALTGCGGPSSAGPSAAPGDYLLSLSDESNIFLSTINSSTGQLGSPMQSGAVTCNNPGSPYTTAITPSKTFLYMLNLCLAGIHTYSISSPGVNLMENQPPDYIIASQGDPDSLAIDRSGAFLYCVTMLPQGEILEFSINGDTGALTAGPTVTESADLRTMVTDPAGNFAFVNDLTFGRIFAYQIGSNGALSGVPGSPFAVSGQPSSLVIENDGKFLFARLNTGGLAAFAIDPETGVLSVVPGSPFATNIFPIALAADPTGRFLYLAAFNGTQIEGFNIDSGTGALTEMASSPFASPVPTDTMAMNSAGTFLYVSPTNYISANSTLAGFTINPSNGSLTAIAGSPLPAAPDVTGMLDLSIP